MEKIAKPSNRYVIEQVAKLPEVRRIKDIAKNRYIKQPHGDDTWPVSLAQAKAHSLNETKPYL